MNNEQLKRVQQAAEVFPRKEKVYFVKVNDVLRGEQISEYKTIQEVVELIQTYILHGYNVSDIKTYEGEEVDLVVKYELTIDEVIMNGEVVSDGKISSEEEYRNVPAEIKPVAELTINRVCKNCKHFGDKPPEGKLPGVVSFDSRVCGNQIMNKRTRKEWRRPSDSCQYWSLKV